MLCPAIRPILRLFVSSLITFSLMGAYLSVRAQEVRTWTDASSIRTIRATLLDYNDTHVRLRRESDDAEFSVDLQKLSEPDRIYVDMIRETKDPNGQAEMQSLALHLPELSLEVIDAGKGIYKVEPLGVIHSPKDGFEWRIANTNPAKLVAAEEGGLERFTLTVLPSAVSIADRRAFIERDWQWTVRSILKNGRTVRNQIIPRNSNRIGDNSWLFYQAEDDNGKFSDKHCVSYCFRSGYTIRIDHAGPYVNFAQSEAEKSLSNLHQVAQTDRNKLVKLSPALQREIGERIQLLKKLVADRDYAMLFVEFLNANDFAMIANSSELAQKEAIANFINYNKPVLQVLVPNLDIQTAWARADGNEVLLFSSKHESQPIALTWNGRWSIHYERMIPKADTVELARLMPEEEAPTNDQAKVEIGDKLEVRPLDGDWVMFSPYGKVPIPESGFKWELTEKDPPTIEASKGTDKVMVVVLAPTPADRRSELIEQLKRDIQQELSDIGLRPLSLEKPEMDPIPNGRAVNFNVRGYELKRGEEVGEINSIMFLDDKTVLCRARSLTTIFRTLELHNFVFRKLEAEDSWFPNSSLDPQIEKEVRAVVADILALIKQQKYEEVLEKFLPPDQLKRMKADNRGWKMMIESFPKRDAIEIVEGLEAINWDKAIFDESTQTLRFGGSKATFTRRDGKWFPK